MKDIRFLDGIATLALLAILAVFVAYATGTLPMHTPHRQAPVNPVIPEVAPTSSVTKKSCGCCAEQKARIQKLIREARERKRAARQAETTAVR